MRLESLGIFFLFCVACGPSCENGFPAGPPGDPDSEASPADAASDGFAVDSPPRDIGSDVVEADSGPERDAMLDDVAFDADTCDTPRMMCADSCVDVMTNRAHCGGCNTPCGGDMGCVDGRCDECASQLCSGVCRDTTSDPANCGGCGEVCAVDRPCVESACAPCAAGQALCMGFCVDVQTNQAHCGRCQNRCIMGQRCMAGECG